MSDTIEAFRGVIANLVGMDCWNVKAGAIGSMASLHLGAKVPLDQPLPYPNAQLTPDEHKFRGEVVLYIEDCPWRLDGTEEVIASWLDDNDPKGAIVTGLGSLKSCKIVSAEVTVPGMDLTLRFDNGATLRIFPDQVDPNEGDNYSLSIKDGATFVVAAKSHVYID